MIQYHDARIIGSQGEMFVSAMLQTGELFRTYLLGNCVEAFDIYVEVNDKTYPFPFLVQVKTTDLNNRYNIHGICTPVSDEKLKWLVDRPIPTYVAGFDLRELKMYLAPSHSGSEYHPGSRCPPPKSVISTSTLCPVTAPLVNP